MIVLEELIRIDMLDKNHRVLMSLDNLPAANPKFDAGQISRILVLKNKNGEDNGIKLWFRDGSTTQAVCQQGDSFDFDTGVSICILKKLLGETKNGGCAYHSLLRKVRKRHQADLEAERKQAQTDELIRRKRAKRAEKKARKQERARQEKIDILAEAIKSAMGNQS